VPASPFPAGSSQVYCRRHRPYLFYGVTVSTLLLVMLSDVAEILTDVLVVTLKVVIVNVADFCPPAMVTVAGTRAADEFELCSATEIPELHAGLET
jgi:hypothetical protein